MFISFRQPGDKPWAEELQRYAFRAGRDAYIVMQDPQPGTDQWSRIEAAIERSDARCVLWGNRTEWSDGVKKELEYCRTHSVREVLLLSKGQRTPSMFDGSIEYMRVDPAAPSRGFADAVEAVRASFVQRSQ